MDDRNESPPRLHWSAYLWPGLPHLWLRGSWAGLAVAVGFSALANVLLASSLVWREWIPVRERWIGLAVLVAVWASAWAEARADWRRWLDQRAAERGKETGAQRNLRLFRQAQQEYLAADWTAAEQTLRQVVRKYPLDIESRLLLATLLRRSKRRDQARALLDELEILEAAAAWQYEIEQERAWLEGESSDRESTNIIGEVDADQTPRTDPNLEQSAPSARLEEAAADKEAQPAFPERRDDKHEEDAPEEQSQSTTTDTTARKTAA